MMKIMALFLFPEKDLGGMQSAKVYRKQDRPCLREFYATDSRLPAGPTRGRDYPERYETEETTERGREEWYSETISTACCLRKKSGITRAVAESMLRPFFVDGRPQALAPGREPHRYQRDRHHGYETPAAGRHVLRLFCGCQGHHHRQQNRGPHGTG